MIVEQIRYFVAESDVEGLIRLRRTIDALRTALDLPPGRILVADPVTEDAPAVVWQCVYDDEGDLGEVEARLIGNTQYEDARRQVADIAQRIELELYTADEDA